MSQSRVEGNRVYCHACDHVWDRAHGGLQCPNCNSEFVEVMGSDSTSRPNSPPPIPPHPISSHSPRSPQSPNPFIDHNPWATDPHDNGTTTFMVNTGSGRGAFSFTTRTYTFGGGNFRTSGNVAQDEIGRNFEIMLGDIMGFNQRRQPLIERQFPGFPIQRTNRAFGAPQPGQGSDPFSLFQNTGLNGSNQSPHPFVLLDALFSPGNAQHGDTVFSQEAFDQIMTQLMEQNSSNAPGPAAESAISRLRTQPVDENIMGSDGKAECSICMDNLELGDEVTFLPCNHWFHGDCVISWLREHDTCPHCRQSITKPTDTRNLPSPSRRRRSSRRSSSVASPINTPRDGNNRVDAGLPDTPSGIREARHRYYGNPQIPISSNDRPSSRRRASDRNEPSTDHGSGDGGGGVSGWIRSRLPFSGSQ